MQYIIRVRLMAPRDQQSGAGATVSDVHKETKQKRSGETKKESDKKQKRCSLGPGSNQLARAPGRLWDFFLYGSLAHLG